MSGIRTPVSSLVQLLRQRALQEPDDQAYMFLQNGETDEVSLTYRELDLRARSIGAYIQRLGGSGERVLLLFLPGLENVAAFFGCLYAGAVAVPSYPPHLSRLRRSLSQLQTLVEDARPAIALTTSSQLSTVTTLLQQSADLQAVRCIATDKVASSVAEQWREPAVSDSTLALLQYTSGSTTMPKGVMISHGNLLHNQRLIQEAFGQTEESTVVSWLPLYHDMGLIGNVIHPLYIGSRCIIMSPMSVLQRPYRWLQAISRYKAHTSGGPNFAYDLCVQKITDAQRATLDLSSWKTAFNGSESVRYDTLERFAMRFAGCGFRRDALYPCYGLAEATLIVSGRNSTGPFVVRTFEATELEHNQVRTASVAENTQTLVGCGRVLLDQQIAIVNPDSSTRCLPDQVGEIWLSGQSVGQGYWHRPKETEYTFQAFLVDSGEGPFLRTGDLGFVEDGELFITGRLKDLIVIDGRNHAPQDIELTVEQSHSSMRQNCCAAFSVDVDGHERLVVAAEIDRPKSVEIRAVERAIRRAVAEHHDLQVYAVSLLTGGRIPKTSSGKIQRRACREGFLAGTLSVVEE